MSDARIDRTETVPDFMMRRDLILMGTIAAIAGIGLAAVLTASLGVRSSGSPGPLRSVAEAPAAKAEPPVIASSEVARRPAPRKRVQKQHRRRVHVAAPAPAPALSPPPVIAQSAPVATRTPAPAIHQQRPQPVYAPAPAPAPKPAPVKPPSRPKHSGGGGGVSFDDSG